MDEIQQIAREATSMMQQMAADINASQDTQQKSGSGSISPKPLKILKMKPALSFSGKANTASRESKNDKADENNEKEIDNDNEEVSKEEKDQSPVSDDGHLSEEEELTELMEQVASYEYDIMGPE